MKLSKINLKITTAILSIFSGIVYTSVAQAEIKNQQNEQTQIYINAGSPIGNYYSVGFELCKSLNTANVGIRCTVRETEGGVSNIKSISDKNNEFAFTQASNIYNAQQDKKSFIDNIRSVASLSPEVLVLVTSSGSDISSLEDLKDKVVSLGEKGSGTNAAVSDLLKTNDISDSFFKKTKNLNPSKLSNALCNGSIDAFFYMSAQPSGVIQNPTTACNAKIVPIQGDSVDKLVGQQPQYSKFAIPGGLYQNNTTDKNTFGSKTVFIASSSVPDEVVFKVLKNFYESFNKIRLKNRAMLFLRKEKLYTSKWAAPLHPGALRYFQDIAVAAPQTTHADNPPAQASDKSDKSQPNKEKQKP